METMWWNREMATCRGRKYDFLSSGNHVRRMKDFFGTSPLVDHDEVRYNMQNLFIYGMFIIYIIIM